MRPFRASGAITEARIKYFLESIKKAGIDYHLVDAGEGMAGNIRQIKRPVEASKGIKAAPGLYQLRLNRNHEPVVQFATLVHELGHLYLGHLGPDKAMKIGKRRVLSDAEMELEAESLSYLVCQRNAVSSNASEYLSSYVKAETNSATMDLYQIMRAAGQVETLLGINAHMSFQ